MTSLIDSSVKTDLLLPSRPQMQYTGMMPWLNMALRNHLYMAPTEHKHYKVLEECTFLCNM